MIIPQFRLSQDAKHVVVVIRVPYVKITSAEFFIDGRIFKFFLHPYLLNIEFKNDLKLAEEPDSASYEHSTYELTVKILKEVEGEHFDDLDLIAKLMVSSKLKENKPNMGNKKNAKRPLIEVIGETKTSEQANELDELDGDNKEEGKNEEDEIEVEMKLSKGLANLVIGKEAYAYGFNNQQQGYFEDLGEEIFELGDFNPDEIPIVDRIRLRTEVIESKFDEDAYIFDTFENDSIEEYVLLLPDILVQIAAKIQYSPEEFNTLQKLPNKEFLIKNKSQSLLEVIDILYAFCYELRCMSGELSCESAATINHVSSTLSCFTSDSELKLVLIESYRRGLTFSMLRHFDIAQKAKEDLQIILKSGRAAVLKILLQINNLFKTSEPRYHLNNLYIDDFCIWVQTLKDADFSELAAEINGIRITKKDLNLNLDEIEVDCIEMVQEAQEQLQEQSEKELKQ